jgi:hypothetical protein
MPLRSSVGTYNWDSRVKPSAIVPEFQGIMKAMPSQRFNYHKKKKNHQARKVVLGPHPYLGE